MFCNLVADYLVLISDDQEQPVDSRGIVRRWGCYAMNDLTAVLAKLVSICIDFFASDDINMPNHGDMSRPPCTWVFTA